MSAADGRTVWVHDIVNVDSGSEPRSIRGFMMDVTARKSADEELARHRVRLEELVEERTAALERSHHQLRRSERLASIGTLAAGIAHQINNPLGGILLAARFAQDSGDDPAALGMALADVVSNTQRCGGIVRSLLRFAREDVLEKGPADLNAIVQSAAGRLSDCGAEVTLHLSDALPPLFLNDIAIGEVIVNLLQNAIDAGAAHIVLETRATRDSALLSVCDDGRGVAPQDLQRVFDPFFTQQTGKGAGLGLSIAHSLVADHGGTIDLTSEEGSGTTVTVNLPIDARGNGEGSHR
jgi:two-component system NtrC family sensor kinase